MRYHPTLLLILTTLALLPVPGSSQEQALRVTPSRARQGDALFIRLTDPAATQAEVHWGRKTYPLFRFEDRWVGSLPVTPDTQPGGHTVTVTVERNGETETLKRQVEVVRTAYPVQNLRMAPQTARLYNYPGVENEDRLLGAAIRARSEQRVWKGDWSLPCRGRFSTPFGVKRVRNGKAVGRHRGVDIAAPKGTPILAPATGRVVLAGKFKKHGNAVVLDHGQGITSLYVHMNAITTREGETVLRGAKLGSVGSTGVSTGPHLHWAVYVHGEPIEPRFFARLSKRGLSAP